MPLAKINNQEIHFQDSKGDGPAIVFMHGFLMNETLFDKQIEALAPRFRCIRWDSRGFGKTRWDGKPFNLYDSVADCFGVMDHLGIESAVLAGMSQGGYCALRAALRSPKRVRGLILMNTRSEADEEPARIAYKQMSETWQTHGPVDPLLNGLATAILGPKNAPDMQAHWDKWLPLWKEIPGNAIHHAMNNLTDRDEISQNLKDIYCPAIVIHGSEDTAIPVSLGEKLSKDLPNCQSFVVAPGAHAVNLTHSDVVNPPILEFLNRLEARN